MPSEQIKPGQSSFISVALPPCHSCSCSQCMGKLLSCAGRVRGECAAEQHAGRGPLALQLLIAGLTNSHWLLRGRCQGTLGWAFGTKDVPAVTTVVLEERQRVRLSGYSTAHQGGTISFLEISGLDRSVFLKWTITIKFSPSFSYLVNQHNANQSPRIFLVIFSLLPTVVEWWRNISYSYSDVTASINSDHTTHILCDILLTLHLHVLH